MKKGVWVSIFAAAAAVAAAAVAVTAFIKRKSEALADHLDYDPDAYFETDDDDDSLYEGDPVEGSDLVEAEEPEEETIPPFPDEQEAVGQDEAVSDDDQAY